MQDHVLCTIVEKCYNTSTLNTVFKDAGLIFRWRILTIENLYYYSRVCMYLVVLCVGIGPLIHSAARSFRGIACQGRVPLLPNLLFTGAGLSLLPSTSSSQRFTAMDLN